MNVRDLIKLLQNMDPKSIVKVWITEGSEVGKPRISDVEINKSLFNKPIDNIMESKL